MKTSKLSIAVLVVVATAFVSACKDGDGNNPSAGGSDTTPPITSNNLPPDPGEAGKATLEGIDSDNDGVRDDVQIAIFQRYPTDEPKRKALVQKAKALQEAVVAGNSSDANMINQVSKSVISAVDCLHERVEDPSSEISLLEDKVINTSDRSEAYIKFNETLSGQFFGDGSAEIPCQ